MQSRKSKTIRELIRELFPKPAVNLTQYTDEYDAWMRFEQHKSLSSQMQYPSKQFKMPQFENGEWK